MRGEAGGSWPTFATERLSDPGRPAFYLSSRWHCRRRRFGPRAAWLDALPETFRDTATAEALQAIVDLDLDALAAIEPPRGYGRD